VEGSTSGWARLLAWDCVLLARTPPARKAVARILAVLLLPFAFQALWTLLWSAAFFAHRRQHPAPRARFWAFVPKRVLVSALCVAFLFYPVVSGSVLSIFNCLALDDAAGNATLTPYPVVKQNVGSFWSEDTSMRCWNGAHR
jgi:hypothetical protein